MVICLKIMEKKFDTRGANNGILSGLVAVTAGAPLINPEGAFVIGVVSAVVYYSSANLLLRLKIDDVVDAVCVFFLCQRACGTAAKSSGLRGSWHLSVSSVYEVLVGTPALRNHDFWCRACASL